MGGGPTLDGWDNFFLAFFVPSMALSFLEKVYPNQIYIASTVPEWHFISPFLLLSNVEKIV